MLGLGPILFVAAAAGLASSAVSADGPVAPGSAAAFPESSEMPEPPVATEPPVAIEPPPPPPAPPRGPRRYGDRGSPEIALGLGYSSVNGFLAAGGFRFFVVDGIAPGVEGLYSSGGKGGVAYGMALGTLRLVPVRTSSAALVLTARGGRVFFADHVDGWGVGGAAGVLLILSAGFGLELGYEFLRLVPASFCADLLSCTLHGPVIGLRLTL